MPSFLRDAAPARTATPCEFVCVRSADRVSTKLAALARRGTSISGAKPTLHKAGGSGEALADFTLTGERVVSVTVWAPGYGPRVGLAGIVADRPAEVIALHGTATDLYFGQPNWPKE